MGKPSSKSKSGLYGMVGAKPPGDAREGPADSVLTFALDGARVTVGGANRSDTGNRLSVKGDVDQLDELFETLDGIELGDAPSSTYSLGRYGDRWSQRELRITVSDKTPWESLVRLAAALCGRDFTLDLNAG